MLEAEWTQGYWMQMEGIYHLKISKHPARIRTRNLLHFGAVPQSTAAALAPSLFIRTNVTETKEDDWRF